MGELFLLGVSPRIKLGVCQLTVYSGWACKYLQSVASDVTSSQPSLPLISYHEVPPFVFFCQMASGHALLSETTETVEVGSATLSLLFINRKAQPFSGTFVARP